MSESHTPLEKWRRRHGLTYQQMGDRIHLSVQHARRIAIGETLPSVETMRRVKLMTCGEVDEIAIYAGCSMYIAKHKAS